MADNSSRVSVVLEDDFSKLLNDMGKVSSALNDIIKKMQQLNKVVPQPITVKVDKQTTKNVQNIEKSLKNASQYANNIGKGVKGAQRSTGRLNKGIFDANSKFQGLFELGKIYFFYNYSKQVFRGIGSLIKEALDFTEVENYFANAMTNMYDEAMKFQDKLEKNGFNKMEMMDAQATLKNMTGALGDLSNKESYNLSEQLTKMAIDYSSLYNVDMETSLKKFEAALSKQVRPIRSQSGYDITQAVLGDTAKSIGMDKTISQMSEIEKRLLIILTLQKQMASSGAVGDWARTWEQPANQLRILNGQVQTLGRNLGTFLTSSIAKVLPYINALVRMLNNAITTLLGKIGFKAPNSKESVLDKAFGGEDVVDTIESAGDATDKATKKAKQWKNVLMGFDVANVLPDQSSDDSSSGTSGSASGGGTSGIDPRLLEYLNYEMKTFDIEQTEAFTKLKKFIEDIKQGISSIASSSFFTNFKNFYEGVWALGSSIWENIAKPLIELGSVTIFPVISGMFTVISDTIGGIAKGLGDIMKLLAEHEALLTFIASMFGAVAITNVVKYIKSMGGIVPVIAEIVGKFVSLEAGVAILDVFQGLLSGAITPLGLIKSGISKLLSVAGKAASTFFTPWTVGIALVVGSIIYFWKNSETFRDTVKRCMEAVGNAFSGLWNTAKSVISNIWDNCLKPFIGNVMNVLEPGFIIAFATIGSAIELFLDAITGVLEFINDVFTIGWSGAWNNAKNNFSEFINKIKEKLAPITGWFSEKFGNAFKAVKNAFSPQGVLTFFGNVLSSMKSPMTNAPAWFFSLGGKILQNIKGGISISSVTSHFKNVYNTVKNTIVNLPKDFKKKFGEAWDNARKAFSSGSISFKSITTSVGKVFQSVVNSMLKGLETVVSSPFKVLNNTLNTIKNTSILGVKPFKWIKTITLPKLPRVNLYEDGGFPNVGEMFIANERGPELVGRMGSKNAVANTMQIVQGITQGVREGMFEVMRYANSFASGDIHLTIMNEDGTKIEKIIKNYNEKMRQTGGEGGFVF